MKLRWLFLYSQFSWELTSSSCLMLSLCCLLAHFLPTHCCHQFSLTYCTTSSLSTPHCPPTSHIKSCDFHLLSVRVHILVPRCSIGRTFFSPFHFCPPRQKYMNASGVSWPFFTLPISAVGFYSPNNVLQHMLIVFKAEQESVSKGLRYWFYNKIGRRTEKKKKKNTNYYDKLEKKTHQHDMLIYLSCLRLFLIPIVTRKALWKLRPLPSSWFPHIHWPATLLGMPVQLLINANLSIYIYKLVFTNLWYVKCWFISL